MDAKLKALIDYYRGRKPVVINRDPTPADSRADHLFHGNIAEILGD